MTEAASRRGQILFGIDAGRRFIDLGNGDPHAGLKGAELFKPLRRLERRRRQGHESRQRVASPSIDADMVIFGCRSGRHRGTAEIQRRAEARAGCLRLVPGDNGLDDLRSRRFRLVGKGDEGRQLGAAGLDRGEKRRRNLRVEFGKISLKVEDDVEASLRVDQLHRLECAVGPGRVILACDDGVAAGAVNGVRNVLVIGGNPYRRDAGRHRPLPDMLDHRFAGDVGKWFSRQPACRHAGRNDDHW